MYDIYNSLCAMSGKTSYVLGQLPLTKNTKQKKKKKKKKIPTGSSKEFISLAGKILQCNLTKALI
jgi:hypothetical protein